MKCPRLNVYQLHLYVDVEKITFPSLTFIQLSSIIFTNIIQMWDTGLQISNIGSKTGFTRTLCIKYDIFLHTRADTGDKVIVNNYILGRIQTFRLQECYILSNNKVINHNTFSLNYATINLLNCNFIMNGNSFSHIFNNHVLIIVYI